MVIDMVLAERAVLQLFLIISTINGLHSTSRFQHKLLQMSSEVTGKESRSPIIVVIRSAEQARTLDDEMRGKIFRGFSSSDESSYSYRNHYFAKLETTNDIYHVLIRNKNHDDSYNLLRNGKISEDDQLQQEIMIANALRSRCQAIVECEEKCPKEETTPKCPESSESCPDDKTTEKCTEESNECETPKPEKYCPKSCKAVFDHLINCPPPGNEKKKKSSKNQSTKACGPATGRTLPPNWKT